MTTRVSDVRSSRHPSRGFHVREVVFSVEEARRALPYVVRLLRDAHMVYQRVQRSRQELLTTFGRREVNELIHQRDDAIDRLNDIIDECNSVGLARIHIPKGEAAFHSVIDQRPVTLLWRIGQPVETTWSALGGCDVRPWQRGVTASGIVEVEHSVGASEMTAHAAR